jgi:hydroxymethylpyrimidine pyrophosphatase-like HAD family hydrolase
MHCFVKNDRKTERVNDKIKVVISDLDGTLLNKQHKYQSIPKQFFELHHQNYLIIIATGRHLDAIPIIEGLGFLYLVTSNGANSFTAERTSFLLT